MSKKRVYELAKELGLENKELIARLEKIGIAVRSHSSTLEDSDLARIQAELTSPEPREVVEQRIKSTVIRRRAVRTPVEDAKPEEAAAPPKAEEPPVAPAPPIVEAAPKEPTPEPVPKEAPVRTSIYRDLPPGETSPKPVFAEGFSPKPVSAPAAKEAVHEKKETPAVKAEAAKPEAVEKKEAPPKPGAEAVSTAPAAEKKPLPVKPPEHREIRPAQAEGERRPQPHREGVRPSPPPLPKEFPIIRHAYGFSVSICHCTWKFIRSENQNFISWEGHFSG